MIFRRRQSNDDATRALDDNATRADVKPDAGSSTPLNAKAICKDLLRHGMTGDKYRIEEQIGQGGMGTVHKVFDQGLKRITVVKVLSPEMMNKPHFLKRFIDEARITGRLEHPNIIPVHDLGVVDRTKIYFSMKYIEGESLGGIILKLRRRDAETESRFSLFTLLTIFRKVCDAVAFAHSKGIIHRDIKPDNVMVARYGEVMLVDWGLARFEKDRDTAPDNVQRTELIAAMTDTTSHKTTDGMIKGTPSYMAPEQAGGEIRRLDRRTDIFLLGSTLYAIATLHPPYTGDTIQEVIDSALLGAFEPPGKRAPERQIPVELDRIIMKAMAVHPEDRYPSVEELCRDVDALLEGHTTSRQARFKTGDYLIREGEPGRDAYLILRGQVDVLKTLRGREVPVVTLGPGDTVGEMAIISDAPRSASVRARADTECVVINAELIEQGLAKLPPWMGATVEALVNRLRSATGQIHPLSSEDCSYHVLNQLRLLHAYGTSAAGGSRIVRSIRDTAREIAANLSIASERVDPILALLLDQQFLERAGDKDFAIPDFNRFCALTDYARARSGGGTSTAGGEIPEFEAFWNQLPR